MNSVGPKKSNNNAQDYLTIKGLKSVNLQSNTVGRRDDDMIVPLSDGPIIFWIDWE